MYSNTFTYITIAGSQGIFLNYVFRHAVYPIAEMLQPEMPHYFR